jgi:hypothetical protein
MALIRVSRPPESAFNPDRPISNLLKAQIQHFHVAHRNLPNRYQTDIYVNAIKTEREAAEYIRQVTEGIHRAHAAAAAKRARPGAKRKRVPADGGAPRVRKGASASKRKQESKSTRRR